jgi:ubiquinone/menaquinone biosynthesis C-methylase UbiE
LASTEYRYTKLAKYYDAIYRNIVDYEKQTSYAEGLFRKYHRGKIKTILDIACGTGNFTFSFAKRGYSVTGIDLSKDMIHVAKEKLKASQANPEFFQMDMRDIKLTRKYDAATAMFGGFSYLLGYDDVKKFFASVKRRLNSKGLLIFEFWHVTAIRPESSTKNGYRTFVKTQDHEKLILRLDTSKFNAATDVCELTFDTVVFNTKTRRMLDSFLEKHLLKTYTISEMKNLLEESGFQVFGFFEDSLGASDRIEPAQQSSFRVMVVAIPKGI